MLSMKITRRCSRAVIRGMSSSQFGLTEQQNSIRKTAADFANHEIRPVAAECDRLSTFPAETIEKLGAKGWMGMCIDRSNGGSGHGLLTGCAIIEELSRCCASTGIIASIHNCLYAKLVEMYGTKDQIERFLRPFCSGQIGAFALSEHNAGSDAANISTTAKLDGDQFVLNGVKAWVTSGCEAKAAVVFASTNRSNDSKGISGFLVPMDATGVTVSPKYEKMGIRATSTCDILLSNVRVPKENLLGQLGDGFKIAMSQMQIGRIGVAAQALGIGQAALDLAVEYACERSTFGERLIERQLVKSKIAKMATDLESARLLTWNAASACDNGVDYRKESSMAKFAASRCATGNAHQCVQIHGAKGFVSGTAERLYRDSRITQIYGGATDIQKMIVANLVTREVRKKTFESDNK